METLNVAAAIICKSDRVLIAQRRKDAHMSLKWEFPGGKIEPGEDAAKCLKREIKEELDLEIEVGRELMVVEHQYRDKKVFLYCHWCRYLGGEAKTRDCHDFKWVHISDMPHYDFAGADRPVVQALMEENRS